MSAGHIYNYFESKEAVIEALIARDVEEIFPVPADGGAARHVYGLRRVRGSVTAGALRDYALLRAGLRP